MYLLPLGEIIVSKVFVGHSMPIQEEKAVDRHSYPKAHSVYRNVDTKHRSAVSEGMCFVR